MGQVKGRPIHAEKRGNIFAALAVVNQLAGVAHLLRCEFRLAPEFDAARDGRARAFRRSNWPRFVA